MIWFATLRRQLTLQNSKGKFALGHAIIYTYIYRMSQEECARLREGVPYVKVYRYNPKAYVQS